MIVIPKSQIEQINIGLSEYQGRRSLDMRSFMAFQGQDFAPTKKGVSIPIEKIDEVLKAVQAAKAEAVAKGWIK